MQLRKYIAIRYNIAARFKPNQWDGKGRANLDPIWLVERLALFDRYCAPSLEGQSLKDFTVLVAFDADTHENYVSTVCGCAEGIDVRPVLVGSDDDYNSRFNAFVQADTDAEYVSITRLDSDDALAPSFMERVDHYARTEIAKGAVDQQPLYIAFPVGHNFEVATGRFTDHDYVTSAFGTMVEKRSQAMKGIYSAHHARMATHYNTVVAASHGAQWCIVIHDNNAANVLKGKPVAVPSFPVGRPGSGIEVGKPDRKGSTPRPAARSGMAPRTMGNFIQFLLGRPMLLRK